MSTKNYSLATTGTGKLAAAFAAQCAPGKAGEVLIRGGCNQDSFAAFLAEYANRAFKAGYDAKRLANALKAMAAGNASQARQAIAELSITFEGDKPQSVSAYWQKSGAVSVSIAPDIEAL